MTESWDLESALRIVAGLLDAIEQGQYPDLQPCEDDLRELQETLPKTKDKGALKGIFKKHPRLLPCAIGILAHRIGSVSRQAIQLARDVRCERARDVRCRLSVTQSDIDVFGAQEQLERRVERLLDEDLTQLLSAGMRFAEAGRAKLAEFDKDGGGSSSE